MTLRFRTLMEINKINPDVLVRANQVARLKSDLFLYLHGHVRRASGTSVGGVVSITLAFDDEYKGGPAHPMPPWFGHELDRNPKARKGWANLTPSRQKEILRYFAGLKSAAARERNLRRALHVLAGGNARFMAREWNAGGN